MKDEAWAAGKHKVLKDIATIIEPILRDVDRVADLHLPGLGSSCGRSQERKEPTSEQRGKSGKVEQRVSASKTEKRSPLERKTKFGTTLEEHSRRKASRLCYICGAADHAARDCPRSDSRSIAAGVALTSSPAPAPAAPPAAGAAPIRERAPPRLQDSDPGNLPRGSFAVEDASGAQVEARDVVPTETAWVVEEEEPRRLGEQPPGDRPVVWIPLSDVRGAPVFATTVDSGADRSHVNERFAALLGLPVQQAPEPRRFVWAMGQ